MPAISEWNSTELREHIARVEDELAAVKAKLPAALRASALGYLGGMATDEAPSIRTQIRRLQDVLAGLRDMAILAEHGELTAEIKRREAAHENDSERLERLRLAATRGDRVIPGTGHAWASAVRADREERNVDFATYEKANIAHMGERKAINALVCRRNALEAESSHLFEE